MSRDTRARRCAGAVLLASLLAVAGCDVDGSDGTGPDGTGPTTNEPDDDGGTATLPPEFLECDGGRDPGEDMVFLP